jgi:hypothetical protein
MRKLALALLLSLLLIPATAEARTETSVARTLFGEVDGTNDGRYREVEFSNGSTTVVSDVLRVATGASGGSGGAGLWADNTTYIAPDLTRKSHDVSVSNVLITDTSEQEVIISKNHAVVLGNALLHVDGDVTIATSLTANNIYVNGAQVYFPGGATISVTDGGTGATTLNDLITLTTHTTGNYADGDAEAGSALSGDTATAFFDAGTIEHERGGLEVDAAAFNGLLSISGGVTSAINLNDQTDLPVHSAALTTSGFTIASSVQGAQIDAGQLPWRLLYDASTDEVAMWQYRMPASYNSGITAKIMYAMSSATSGTVEYEVAVMAISDGDSQDTNGNSFDTVNTGTETVPGTAGHLSEISITLTNNDSVVAGDLVYIVLSTDADDGTNDTATGDREVLGVQITWSI